MKVTPAEKIIAKFGGATRLSEALKVLEDPRFHRDPSSVFRWTYPRDKSGTGGYIPTSMVDAVKKAARLNGILLTPEDFF